MSLYFLDRIDAAPLQDDDFSFSFNSWVATTIDSLNEVIINIQDYMNGLNEGIIAPSLTQAEIIALSLTAVDGTIWYCTDHTPDPVYVGLINGNLVQFTTTAFP